MPQRLKAIAAFWYDFLIGDDWLIPVIVIAGLAATFGLAHEGLAASWPLPVAVALVLPASLWRAVRRK